MYHSMTISAEQVQVGEAGLSPRLQLMHWQGMMNFDEAFTPLAVPETARLAVNRPGFAGGCFV
jgi:hypothetical protein